MYLDQKCTLVKTHSTLLVPTTTELKLVKVKFENISPLLDAKHSMNNSTSCTAQAQAALPSPDSPQTYALSPVVRRSDSFSRDEMNLAEFPLAALSTRVDQSVKTLEFTDTIKLPGGEVIERKWIITGADKFGLPTSTDDDVVLGLIRLTMDQGFRDRKVYFTRYELLKALRWSTEGRSYTRLIKSLDRLSGVRLRSTNSFYDNTTKTYQTCNFGVIDAYEINNERTVLKADTAGETPKSFFVWSEMLFDSFKAGYIKKLDLDLYFSLKSAVSRRLYRYLDKHFYYRSSLEMPLMVLAFEKVGLSRTYKYVSSVKQQLEPAAKELVEVQFLSSYEFLGRGEQTAVRFVSAKGSTAGAYLAHHDGLSGKGSSAAQSSMHGENITAELVRRGIAEAQAKKLMAARTPAECEKISAILRYYDHLVATNDRRVSRNKAGFLYRAVETPYKFSIPPHFTQGAKKGGGREGDSAPRAARPELRIFKSERDGRRAVSNVAAAKRSAVQQDPSAALEQEYRVFCQREVRRVLAGMRNEEIDALQAMVNKKMGSLKEILDPSRYRRVVESALHEEVRKIWGIPDFSTWLVEHHHHPRAVPDRLN